MDLTFEEVYPAMSRFVDKPITIAGRILVADGAFLAVDYEGYERGERLLIRDNGRIERALLDTLPVWGGGNVIFDERAHVSGMIQCDTEGNCEFLPSGPCRIRGGDVDIEVSIDF